MKTDHCTTRGWSLKRKLAHGSRPTADGCRLWVGKREADGFARLWWKGRHHAVHRLAYCLNADRPIARGVKILQSCGYRHCIARGHLYAGSQVDVTRKTRRPRGEKNGNHRLTDRQVHAIRSARPPMSEIAARFDVSRETIRRIRNGIAWTHLLGSRVCASKAPRL
jgi:hypothetical protein